MKKWVRGISAFFLAIALAGCAAGPAASEEAKFEAGTYIGTGNNGEVEVQIVFTDSEIVSVEVVSLQEIPGLSDTQIADIPQQIVERRI